MITFLIKRDTWSLKVFNILRYNYSKSSQPENYSWFAEIYIASENVTLIILLQSSQFETENIWFSMTLKINI